MKLLFIGGTKFLGRHTVEAAVARGHEVTLFNRGRQNPDLFPEAEHLRGDRDGDLGALGGRGWDTVVDTCGYTPRVVRASARLLSKSVGLYVFVSSISVYADHSAPRDEAGPLAAMPDETIEEVTGETYGPLKVLCERAVEEELPGRALVVRPGLIVGPHDPTARFSYWTRRVARGGEVLAPGSPDSPVQFVDARDLGEWIVRMAEGKRAGVFNATGPDYPLTFGRFLKTCREVSRSDARFTWVDEKFLLEQGVEPWSQLPLWLDSSDENLHYFMGADCRKALAAGLAFRPLADTVRDTLAWQNSQPDGGAATRKDGVPVPDHTISPERERELLRLWHDGG
jgi:2'-hydroxyisoflavone reductase